MFSGRYGGRVARRAPTRGALVRKGGGVALATRSRAMRIQFVTRHSSESNCYGHETLGATGGLTPRRSPGRLSCFARGGVGAAGPRLRDALPAAVDPEILLGSAADDALQRGRVALR